MLPEQLTVAEYLEALGRGSWLPTSPSGDALKAVTNIVLKSSPGKPFVGHHVLESKSPSTLPANAILPKEGAADGKTSGQL